MPHFVKIEGISINPDLVTHFHAGVHQGMGDTQKPTTHIYFTSGKELKLLVDEEVIKQSLNVE